MLCHSQQNQDIHLPGKSASLVILKLMRFYEELSFEYFLGKHSTTQILTSLSIEFPLLFLPFFFKKLLFKRLIWTAIEVRLDCPSLSNLILTLEITMLCLKRTNRNCSFSMIIRTTFHNIFIHLYAFIMSCTRFRVIVAWTSGNSLLETGAISEV